MTEVQLCVFDAYGTLFDVHSAVKRHAASIGPKADELSKLWRVKQLEYTWVRSLMRRHADFWECTTAALDFALASLALADSAPRKALLDAYLQLDAYPEVPSMLAWLRQSKIRAAVLSNGTPAMLQSAARSAQIEDLLEAYLSIEDCGIYKPDPSVYRLVVDRFGVKPAEVSFQSSNAWDVAGARAYGFRVVWVNRSRQPAEYGLGGACAEVASLSEFPATIRNSPSA